MNAAVHPVILIVGPTAVGKTELALGLASALQPHGEIVSADSMLVYNGMDIGTAKPTAEERAMAPHHLIDIIQPDEPFTVSDWLNRAQQCIEDIRSRGRWPIMVGGANLYINAFLRGLFDGPKPDEELRAALADQPTKALHERLQKFDPAAADRIHPNDRKRLTRAIEVYQATGKPISAWQTQWEEEDDAIAAGSTGRKDVILIGLGCPREELNSRINARVKKMVAQGLFEEVSVLHSAGSLGIQAREALGYKQVIAHMEGRWTKAEAIEQIKIDTRRFARKQGTWLRRFRVFPRSIWFDSAENDIQSLLTQSLTFIFQESLDSDPP